MKKYQIILGALWLSLFLGGNVLAETLNSPNYSLPESYIGPGESINSTSPNYQTRGTVGDTATGQSQSDNYQSQQGADTPDEPRLTLMIDTGAVNFGAFSSSVAATATSTFKVLNYTTYGYGVYTIGAPPGNGLHNLNGMSSTGASQVGVEQYGINLKANTSPVSFGADPVQVPGGTFSFGQVSAGYNTANNFRYVNGEKIAEASKNSGETDYTISYIVNTSTTTPGGTYSGSQGLVVVGTY